MTYTAAHHQGFLGLFFFFTSLLGSSYVVHLYTCSALEIYSFLLVDFGHFSDHNAIDVYN